MQSNYELKKIFDAGNELAAKINEATEDEIEELNNYVGDGFPIAFDVEFDADFEVENIYVAVGHGDGMEWHDINETIENLRALPKHQLLMMLTDSIEIAIENHRDQVSMCEEFAA